MPRELSKSEIIFQMKGSLIMVEDNQEVTRKCARIGGSVCLAKCKWCARALYIPFGGYDHSCIKEYLVTLLIEVSLLRIAASSEKTHLR